MPAAIIEVQSDGSTTHQRIQSTTILLIVDFLVLLILANATPVFARRILGGRFGRPLDGGIRFIDGQPLFGASKTVRGLVVAVAATTLAAPLLGLPWYIGTLAGAASMAGDLLSSFTKRRLQMPPSSRAPGLDQVPEALLPLLVCQPLLGLTLFDITAVVVVFLAGGLLVSPLFYRLGIRRRPY